MKGKASAPDMVLASQFGAFLLVGGFSTALQYVILAVLVQAAGTDGGDRSMQEEAGAAQGAKQSPPHGVGPARTAPSVSTDRQRKDLAA